MHKLYNSLVSSPWLATLDCVQHLHDVYWRIIDRRASGESLDITALSKELGRPLDNTRTVETRNGVAIIPIEDVIFRRGGLFTDISGGVTVETLAKDFNVALNNPAVKAILLNIDSPGGEMSGINEFADMVYEARGQKPIVAYVSHTGASAAYWIASAAGEIVMDASASLGSIGVIISVSDPSKENSRSVKFISSQSPKKRPDPTTTEGQSDLSAYADSLAEVFIEAVMRNREVSRETVINDFGKGGMLVGKAAVQAGLADRIGSFEQVLSELSTGTYSSKRRPRMAATSKATNPKSEVTTMPEKKSILARIFGSAELSDDDKKEIVASINAQATADPGQAQQPPATQPPATLATAFAPPATGNAEFESIKQELETERNARFKSEAEAFADVITGPGQRKALPAERAAIITGYITAAQDDVASPRQISFTEGGQVKAGTRVDAFKAAFAARPSHNLTREFVPFDPTQHVALDANASADQRMLEEARKQGEQYAAQANRKK
jgi:capsid assembly protease